MDTQQTLDPNWAWAPYRPSTEHPWTLARAGHLYRRAAFGANWTQLQQALVHGPRKTIDGLLTPPADLAAFNRTYDDYDRSVGSSESADELRAWWLRRMLLTPCPLLEKMTLFWHSHFAVSNGVVKSAAFMRQYLQLIRSQALGSFHTLVQDMVHDPALLIGMDAIENRKSRPNESLARTLIEDFTLGTGAATDQDIRQAARAFTGNFVRRGRFLFIEREHDDGDKQLFGQTGPFTDKDVISILLEQPATAEHIVHKVYAWLLNEASPPSDSLMAPLTRSFARDYNMSRLVETMLRSNLFFSEACYRQRIKCPVEYALGMVQGLEGMVSTTQLATDLAALGQNLFHPPTLRGWPGKEAWINQATLIQRANLAHALLQGSGPYQGKLDARAILEKYAHTANQPDAQFFADLFLQQAMTPASGESIEQSLYDIVTSPEFNLA
ncbi:MAG: DUF1800 domain-containing protein [Phycisphaerae bacterium]|nr:DUF1800 domain-containing protein [Phycisphaerae bacterium]